MDVDTIVTRLFNALRYGRGVVRIAAVMSIVAGLLACCFFIMRVVLGGPKDLLIAQFMGGLAALLAVGTSTLQRAEEIDRERKKIEVAEKRVEAEPDKPQLAWELAQVRLESYLTRNLAQVKSIYLLTVIVMFVGFSLIGVGSYYAFHDDKKFHASVLSAVSGVIVSFIGGTFLVLYKATMAQAKEYVTILERINAVGMSVQILESLGDDPKLKRESMAEIAKQLLHMYSTNVPGTERKSKKRADKAPTQ